MGCEARRSGKGRNGRVAPRLCADPESPATRRRCSVEPPTLTDCPRRRCECASMTAILQPIGAIVGAFGAFWFLCDRHATAPGYMIGLGLIALVTGGAL